MEFTKEFFDKEIQNARQVMADAERQRIHAEGALSTLEQMRQLLDKPELTVVGGEDNASG